MYNHRIISWWCARINRTTEYVEIKYKSTHCDNNAYTNVAGVVSKSPCKVEETQEDDQRVQNARRTVAVAWIAAVRCGKLRPLWYLHVPRADRSMGNGSRLVISLFSTLNSIFQKAFSSFFLSFCACSFSLSHTHFYNEAYIPRSAA